MSLVVDGTTNSVLQRFCTEADARNVLQCLKQNKNSELMDPKCKQMITKRQITQNTGMETTHTQALLGAGVNKHHEGSNHEWTAGSTRVHT